MAPSPRKEEMSRQNVMLKLRCANNAKEKNVFVSCEERLSSVVG
jgi:hypothetical protein